MDDIHPLVLKVAGQLVPVAIGGMAADVKFLVDQLRDSEECGGWQYVMTAFFHQAVGHPTYRFEERTICFCVPDKFRVKVPNIFICDRGAYGSTIGLAAAGWLLRVLGIVPRRDTQSEDEVWLLLLTASAVLPAQLLFCLPESPCLAACFTGRQGLFNEFCEQLAAYVQEMDCVYLVNWDAWMPRIRDCMPVVVQRSYVYSDLVGYQTSDIRLLWTITPKAPPPPTPTPFLTPPPPLCQTSPPPPPPVSPPNIRLVPLSPHP